MLLAMFLPSVVFALDIDDVAISAGRNSEMLSLELSSSATHHVFSLKKPDRIVIDLPPFKWKVANSKIANMRSKFVKRIRYARFDSKTSRLVLDMYSPVELEEVISGKNKRIKKFRIRPVSGKTVVRKSSEKIWSRKRGKVQPPVAVARKVDVLPTSKQRELEEKDKPLIVIDAGHGGKDPGAIGNSKTREKNVTLRYARALRDILNKTGKFRAKLTRNSDKIIVLRERFRIARRSKADLFISLHADSAPNQKARGLSIYTLSEKASDKEAAALAHQENMSDVIAGVDLTHEDEEVAGILIDLTRRETKNKSVKLAEQIVKSLKGKIKLLSNTHRHAGFAVLKAPDIPSVLVEIGFLTNHKEERLINQREHQDKVVNGLAKGIRKYFASRR